MKRLAWLGYEAAGRVAAAMSAVAPMGDSKLVRTFAARRGIDARYRRWGADGRDPARPLLWVHAPSVGEGLQARPVLTLTRQRRPEIQLAYTHFSPSAAAFAAALDVDFHDYLPFDTSAAARNALDALRPTALVFSKLDVWPRLVEAAASRGVSLGLVSATLPASSSRQSKAASLLLRKSYRSLHAVGAIDARDADRLVCLGVLPDAIEVTGDTRYDQVWDRASSADRSGPLLGPLKSDRPTLVAGSTWGADEAVLLPAWAAVRARHPEARLIVAPHEPTPAHIAPIERWGAAQRLTMRRLGAADAPGADVIVVDRVGVLGELYALADVAFVGGGHHRAGLHSVLEPAAYGAPVLFGPYHQGSRDASLLIEAGGGVSCRDVAALATQLREWTGSPAARQAAGERAREVVRAGLGAAERSFALVERLLAR